MVLTCLAFALLCVSLSSQRAVSQAFSDGQEKNNDEELDFWVVASIKINPHDSRDGSGSPEGWNKNSLPHKNSNHNPMNQTWSNSSQEIEEEVGFPAQFILYKNPKDPEEDGVPKEMEKISMEKHGSNQLPGIGFSGDREKIASDPEIEVKVSSTQGDENEPVGQ